MAYLAKIFGDPTVPGEIKHAALARMNVDPGIPISNPTKSFWLSKLHSDFTCPTSNAPPSSAYCVIIGSGITGTAVARQLVRSRLSFSKHSNEDIVLLDARDICGGATGRNGGHINEVGFADYRELREAFGKEKAIKIMRFRLSHLDALTKVARDEGLENDSQIRALKTATVFFDEDAWNDVKDATRVFKNDLGHVAEEWEILESIEELKKYGTETAKGIILSRAGAAWPYRLITGILSNLAHSDPNFHIYPFTPVTSIQKISSSAYTVSTPRGQIKAKHIIHCTNSHISHLVPCLRNRIFPVRGQMSAQAPPNTFPFQGDRLSWSLNYHVGFDYLTQLPKNIGSKDTTIQGGHMMLGGGMVQARYHGVEELGVSHDSDLNPDITDHLSSALSEAFTSAEGEDFEIKSMWTGNMGFSTDSMPWVGRLPESVAQRECKLESNAELSNGVSVGDIKSGEWISAGYTGEGMVNAWLCGTALAMMLSGQEKEIQPWFPEQYLISEDRLRDHTVEKFIHM